MQAVKKVKAWSTRGKLPHGIEATSFLTTITLNDSRDKQTDSNTLQLSYTMALIRFVNGLLDPFQQSNYAIPMHLLAKQLNLPTYFVELRHMGTHENLPSLDILRITCSKALSWLYENYWNQLDEETEEEKPVNLDVFHFRVKLAETRFKKYQIFDNLKTFKKIRKQDLNKVYEPNATEETALAFHKCLADIIDFANVDSDLFITILLHKHYLVYPASKVKDKKVKFNPLIIKLYQPLLDRLNVDFKIECFNRIIDIIKGKKKSKLVVKLYKKFGFAELSDDSETIQLMEWLSHFAHLITHDDLSNQWNDRNAALNTLIDRLKTVESVIAESMLSNFATILSKITEGMNGVDSQISERLTKWHKEIETIQETKKAFDVPPSLDELLGLPSGKRPLENTDNEGSVKKPRIDDSETYLLTPYEDWKPTPFGISS
ncbi:las1 Pre-rRNA-processing protein las1 [Candida maltosa Xu316]